MQISPAEEADAAIAYAEFFGYPHVGATKQSFCLRWWQSNLGYRATHMDICAA